MAYAIEERETVIRTDDQMKYWEVESRQRKFITKIKKINGCVILSEESTEKGIVFAGRYQIPIKSVSFRKLRENASEEPENEDIEEIEPEEGDEE